MNKLYDKSSLYDTVNPDGQPIQTRTYTVINQTDNGMILTVDTSKFNITTYIEQDITDLLKVGADDDHIFTTLGPNIQTSVHLGDSDDMVLNQFHRQYMADMVKAVQFAGFMAVTKYRNQINADKKTTLKLSVGKIKAVKESGGHQPVYISNNNDHVEIGVHIYKLNPQSERIVDCYMPEPYQGFTIVINAPMINDFKTYAQIENFVQKHTEVIFKTNHYYLTQTKRRAIDEILFEYTRALADQLFDITGMNNDTST